MAARSGIAKTTIYRRHRDRRDVLSAALSRMTAIEPLAAQVEAPDQLRWLIREAVKTIEVGFCFGGFAALLTDDDPDFTKLFRRNLADKRAALDHFASISTGRHSSTPWSVRTSTSAPAQGGLRPDRKRVCSVSSGQSCRGGHAAREPGAGHVMENSSCIRITLATLCRPPSTAMR